MAIRKKVLFSSTLNIVNLFFAIGVEIMIQSCYISRNYKDGNMPRAGKLFLILNLWILASLWPSSASALNRILGIRHWVAPDHTRVVIDTSEDARFTAEKEDRRFFVDLELTEFPSHLPEQIVMNKPGLEGMALSTRTPSGVRVELSLPGPVQTSVFKLKKYLDKPYRIVIDIVLPEVARKESENRERVKITRKDRIVVIDPGHGGEALGAVGRRGTFEKEVVLSISKKLRDLLSGQEGYRAFLTRDGDYYVSFQKRLTIAREYGADLFISIHADAAKNRTAAGGSVYCLSTGGASSEAAKILARNENLADVVGGVPNGEGSDASDPIILDMFQTHTLNQSRIFGGRLLKHLERANHLKFAMVQEAPFRVLKLPQTPSVLVETAYISNPKEEQLLRSDRFQRQIAEAVATSIVEFIPPFPPVAVSVRDGEKAERNKEERVTVNEKQQQGGERTPLPVNRLLKISGSSTSGKKEAKANPETKLKSPAKKDTVVLYRVKKGDTLAKIARRYGTTARILMEINHLKPSEPLFVDRKINVPVSPSMLREREGQGSVSRSAVRAGG
jgi:N-acetylmuramoyl-L-alanine amidase